MKTNPKKVKAILIGFAVAAIPLVTTATCSPGFGTLNFYRDDHYHDHGVVDIFIQDDCYFYDCYYYDDYYYDDYYYQEIIIYD